MGDPLVNSDPPSPSSTVAEGARRQLALEVSPRLYQKIRRLWIKHSRAEDARDVEVLISTLSEDCVYEIVPTGQRWEGHDGARSFYGELLGAFPDVHFDLIDIVIGPQGVIEVVDMTGTHQAPWAGMPATGRRVNLRVLIHFPWDTSSGKFAGERVYFDSVDIPSAE
ncbi:MAG: ester cyclase [Anaerolineales bacterium]